MSSEWLSEYLVAFWIGLGVIWIFAWKQFTQPSYERLRRFEEILKLLNPRDLRSGGVFFPAYFFYALILSALYWVLCTFGSLQLLSLLGLPNLGIDSPGESVGAILPQSWSEPGALADPEAQRALLGEFTRVFEGERDLARNPTVPLTIALTIVGVIPNVPFFVKFEEKLRVVAHRLAGIPGRLFEGTRFLVEADLRAMEDAADAQAAGLADPPMLAVPRRLVAALRRLDPIDDKYADSLSRVLYKIYFFRDNILGVTAGIDWPAYSVHDAYQSVTDNIAKRVADLDGEILRLEDRLAALGPEPDPATMAELRGRRDALFVAARQLENDICALLLVYAEKDGLPKDRAGPGAQLRNFIRHAHEQAAHDTIGFNVFVNTLITIVLISGAFALLFGRDTAVNDPRQINYFVHYVVTALMTYTLATLVALTYRQVTLTTTWSSLYKSHWIKGVMQLLWVFVGATAIAYFCLAVWNVYATVQTTGNIVIVERWEAVLRGALSQEWPRAVLGGIFAVFIVLGVDYWEVTAAESRDGRSTGAGLGPALVGGLVLAIWGALIVIITAAQNNQPVIASYIVQTAGLAFLIGTGSGLVVQSTLRSIKLPAV
jgi:hypothetical protein